MFRDALRDDQQALGLQDVPDVPDVPDVLDVLHVLEMELKRYLYVDVEIALVIHDE